MSRPAAPIRIALTRGVSPDVGRCQLTHIAREPIDYSTAVAQHAAYEQCLADLGCEVTRLSPGIGLPDAVFIEDTAIVLEELAVITRPGAPSRRREGPDVADALRHYRPLSTLRGPGTLDGGDVLVVDHTLYVGHSTRTDAAGAGELQRLVGPYGYTTRRVVVGKSLHLKSAVTAVAEGTLLVNPECVDTAIFQGMCLLEVDPAEPFGANAVRIGDTILYPSAYERTRRRLEAEGLTVRPVDASELAKAEGGVTCCSLIFTAQPG